MTLKHKDINAAERPDNLKLAVASILFAVLALSFADAVIKLLSSDLSLWQIYILRSVLALPVVIAIVKIHDRKLSLIPVTLGWTTLRSCLLGFMWIAYYAALPHVKLSVAAAVYYTIPLFITLFSALFAGERVKPKSWLAIVIGFIGVLVIVRPDRGEFNAYVLLPLLAAILFALAMILTRTKCRDENPGVLSFSLNVTFIVMGLIATLMLMFANLGTEQIALNPFLLSEWRAPVIDEWIAMAVLAAVVTVGSIFAAFAYQNGPSSVIATFDYSYLAFSALWGFVIFVEIPDVLAIFGMFLIVLAGLMVLKD